MTDLDHFLSLPRPDVYIGPPTGAPDTTTLAAHDFDVDTRTGFMPPQAPLGRLTSEWEQWESVLEDAIHQNLRLGDSLGLSQAHLATSESWRSRVQHLPVLPITDLKKSEVALRRAHCVLAWIMHFYVHSLPPHKPISIPPSITLPLLRICAQLQLPPVLTYSDNVLYNWELKRPSSASIPDLDNLRCQTLFTSTIDEQEFYLTSARIELKGVEVLELMRATMDEAFVGDALAIQRITTFLRKMAVVIQELRTMLLAVRDNCNPEVFYRDIRPWLRGADSDPHERKWVFEGLDQDPDLQEPTELSGPSAGQSTLVHALDIFLGVDKYSHSSVVTGHSSVSTTRMAFLNRMQLYMPRHHRRFLNHLSSNPRPLRSIVSTSNDPAVLEAYNAVVLALKEFRNAHMIIVALYIIGPARRELSDGGKAESANAQPLKGTGGTELVRFLKDVRDLTASAVISPTVGL